MNMSISITAALLATVVALPSRAQADDPHRLGDHPAIVVQRLHARQGYDYLSKFYPHPAWLYLLPEAPHRMNDHPAVAVFKREQEREAALTKALLAKRSGVPR